MRRDILLGMILAAVLHFSAALYSHMTRAPARMHGPVLKEERVARLVLPLDPRVDIDPDAAEVPPPKEIPPPRTTEEVQVAIDRDFVIPPEPPTPPILGQSGVCQIPVAISTSALNRVPFRMDEVDRAPLPVLQVAPAYPAAMKARHIEGRVVVQFVVDANSNVRDVRVVSSTSREFEYPALQAVQKWRFKAGRKANQPVAVLMEVPINFHLAK
jgi:protein TonB